MFCNQARFCNRATAHDQTAVNHLLHKNALIYLALLLLLVAVFIKPVVMQKPAYRFMLTFDISQSMGVADVVSSQRNISRLEFAKQASTELIEQMPCGSSVGFSIFTQRRVLPLTTPVEVCQHYAGLLASLEFISGNMRWANASGIGKGLHQSILLYGWPGSSTVTQRQQRHA